MLSNDEMQFIEIKFIMISETELYEAVRIKLIVSIDKSTMSFMRQTVMGIFIWF